MLQKLPLYLGTLTALLLSIGSCGDPDPATVDLPNDLFVAFGEDFSLDDGTLMPLNPNCAIKGNVSTEGDEVRRVYHMPDDHYYHFHKIVAEEGDLWFCSEEEAQAAGFVRSFK